ncbi:interferon-like [Malurus melanocephalus]|uniref:interferon-like n=1 Tax=Malurus melanocephalus TaxID=175006 RepID=UPI0025495EB9|nr:interferon-like [Malurus melanocephalus]
MPAPTAPRPRLPHAAPPLLLLLTALATALACQHLWTPDDTFPADALRLLRDMAPSHAQPCHLQQPPFFPDALRHNNLHCAWDHVRIEARASLQHLHNLTRTMRR